MKKILRNSIFIAFLAVTSVLAMTACSDWTEDESLDVKTPTFEGQNPGLYADYIKNLLEYKARPHKVTFVAFENNASLPSKQAEHISILPDSIDYISLNNPEAMNPVIMKEIEQVRAKGTKVIYDVDFGLIDTEWQQMEKDDVYGDLTETMALDYIVKRTGELLSICEEHGYDGITFKYAGRSHASLTPQNYIIYAGRQKVFFEQIAQWRATHKDMAFSYMGHAEYLVDENKPILEECDYVILMTDMLTNGTDMTIKVQTALATGGIPSDRFIASVQPVRPDDANKIFGWFATVGEDGNQLRSIVGAAMWVGLPSEFSRMGLYVTNAHNDYYDNTPVYGTIRRGIEVMNPSPNN